MLMGMLNFEVGLERSYQKFNHDGAGHSKSGRSAS
jgi:hypothetical protein